MPIMVPGAVPAQPVRPVQVTNTETQETRSMYTYRPWVPEDADFVVRVCEGNWTVSDRGTSREVVVYKMTVRGTDRYWCEEPMGDGVNRPEDRRNEVEMQSLGKKDEEKTE